MVGVVGADAWYPTLTSLIYVLNSTGTFPSSRSGSTFVNFQNLNSPLSTNQRELGLFFDEYTGYFVGFELQNPNRVIMKLYESDSSSSAVKGTGTIILENTESGQNYSLSYEIPGGRRVLKALIELTIPNGSSSYSYTTQFILGTGPNKRVVEGNGVYSFFYIGGDMEMTHNGRITNFQNIGITGAGAMGTFTIDGISGQLGGALGASINVRIDPVGSQPGMTGDLNVIAAEFTMTPDGGTQGQVESVFAY